MIQIPFFPSLLFLALLWLAVRAICWCRQGKIQPLRELQLLPVFICLAVAARVTFFPFALLDGKVQPLLFSLERMLPPRINLIPLLNLFDYPVFREAMINFVGNVTLFIPMGIVWPLVYKELNTHGKVLAAGVGLSLTIELLQLPFFDRVTDIDDLLLNSLGYAAGYGIYLLTKWLIRHFAGRKAKIRH